MGITEVKLPQATTTVKQKRIHLKHNIIVASRMKTPPIRGGTNRYRNMQVVLGCHTVGEALQKLKALRPAPGSATDIKLAEKVGAIELLTPLTEEYEISRKGENSRLA